MKRFIGMISVAALLALITACGNSTRDLSGKWVFSDIVYYDSAVVKTIDPFEYEQTKDLFKGMTYHFKDETHFTLITPNLNDETQSGTYALENGGEELVLRFENDKKRFHIKELKERKLVLEALEKGKQEDEVGFVYTR